MPFLSPTAHTALIYFFSCCSGGLVTIFLPIFFAQVGLTEFQIGIIAALNPVVAMLGNPLWGAVADAYPNSRKHIMVGLSFASLVSVTSLVPIGLFVRDLEAQFGYTLLVTCVATFAGGSIGSLLDAIVVEQVPKNAYGRLRLFCAIGYGGSAGLVGVAMYFVERYSAPMDWLPYATHFAPAVVCSLITMALMSLMPNKKSSIADKRETDERSSLATRESHISGDTCEDNEVDPNISIQGDAKQDEIEPPPAGGFFAQIAQVPKTLDMFLFVMVIFLCGCCMGLVSTFLFIFIKTDLPSGSQLIMGVSVLVTCATEVPVFFFSEHVLNRIPADWTLVVSLFAYVLRFGLYWFLAAYDMNAWCILLPEVMHGFTYALMWCSAVAKATEIIGGLSLTNFAIGFISGVLTCGNAIGSLVSGAMLRQGVSMLWVWEGSTYVMAVWTVIWTAKSLWEWHVKK